jgi:hypothetical protein
MGGAAQGFGGNRHPVHQNSSLKTRSENSLEKEDIFKDSEKETEKEIHSSSQDVPPNSTGRSFSEDDRYSTDYEGKPRRTASEDFTRKRSRESYQTERGHRRTQPPRQNHMLTIVLITLMVVVVIAAAVVVVFAIRGRGQSDKMELNENTSIATSEEKRKQLENADTYYVTNAVSYLSMRSEADSKSSIVGELYNGNSVKVLSNGGDYWYIYSEDLSVYGYVDCSYLTADRSSVSYGEETKQDSDSKRKTGYGNAPQNYEFVRYAYVNSGYLALRSAQSSSDSNIIGELYNYYPVQVISSSGTYWYVYSADLGMYGYVNSSYLIGESSPTSSVHDPDIYYASVNSGYLALRNAQAFDSSNEIGKLYNGDRVEVMDYSGTYWYVYAPTLRMYGYVNSEYLVQ